MIKRIRRAIDALSPARQRERERKFIAPIMERHIIAKYPSPTSLQVDAAKAPMATAAALAAWEARVKRDIDAAMFVPAAVMFGKTISRSEAEKLYPPKHDPNGYRNACLSQHEPHCKVFTEFERCSCGAVDRDE